MTAKPPCRLCGNPMDFIDPDGHGQDWFCEDDECRKNRRRKFWEQLDEVSDLVKQKQQHDADAALGRKLRSRPELFAWAMSIAADRVLEASNEFERGDYEALRDVEAELHKERGR